MAIISLEELKSTHSTYQDNIEDWHLYQIAYAGGRKFIDYAIEQHPRESAQNALLRRKEAIVFNYAKSIIDLYNFYLTEKDAMREMMSLAKDTQWSMFRQDCDLFGTNFNTFIVNAQKVSSIYGSVGILVDKTSVEAENKQQEIMAGIYPYCNLYTLPNILDWTIERNAITNRPVLTYLKILDHDNKYLIWTLDNWETWEIPSLPNGKEGEPVLVDNGENKLGEIPFIWYHNIRNPINPMLGLSDIVEIAPITASIIRDLSSLQEIIKFAGFPMMRRPMEEDGADIVSVRSVLEFDPEMPDAKPDWLESEVLEPVRGGLEFIERKIDEVFEMAHMSGIHALEKSTEARSGVALRYQFSQLSAVLGEKADNMIEAEYSIVRLWLKWQNMSELFSGIGIRRTKRFSIDDLAQDLDNMLKVQKATLSKTCVREIQKSMTRMVLTDVPDVTRQAIDNEIEEAKFNLESNAREGGNAGEDGVTNNETGEVGTLVTPTVSNS